VAGRIDVLGLGAVAVDDMLFLDHFPSPDSKVPVQRTERRAGGLAGTALVAARRMGRSAAYAGTLGGDELSRFILDAFAAEGVDVSRHVRKEPAPPFHATILIEARGHTRTILLDTDNVVGASDAGPPEEAIRGARALLVDHVGLPGMIRAARIARAAGVPVIADFERAEGALFQELLSLADHLILPYEFAREISGAADGPGAASALWAPGRAAVVVTRSAEGCWYTTAEESGRVFHQPAFAVTEVDTNGCGDVFHGVYAAGLCDGMIAAERIRFASLVAALKAARAGGQKAIPARADAERSYAERAEEALRSPC
jgi:sugar/nucleoside kinase (ribokinase family)